MLNYLDRISIYATYMSKFYPRQTKSKPKACNDLPEAPRFCSTECCVDDTKLFVSFHSQDTQPIVEEMNEDLLGVRNWCFRNRLLTLLNPYKKKLIAFGRRQMTSKLHEFRLSLLGKAISPAQSAKDRRDFGFELDF